MTVEITKKMEYADRVAVQQADQAIRKDVVRALVELITNCNDSYQRMEDAGIENTGEIIIELQRKRINSILRVRDNAEGMAAEDMDAKISKYGEATSGFKEGKSVRGLWGRGLKDSFFGLGYGTITSIRDNIYNRCSLLVEHGKPLYKREKSQRATKTIKNQYALSSGSGTIIEVIVSREDVRIPQLDTLRRSLERHFELRGIMGNSKRKVFLRNLNASGKIENESILNYKGPVGIEVLNKTILVGDRSVEAQIQVFRANESLTTPVEEGAYADGGLLIMSKGIVLSLDLFKFERNEHAARFYGNVSCDYLHDLLKSDDHVLTATRDGINWKHEFSKSLKEAVETCLEPLVEEERKRAQAEQRGTVNRKLRERLDNALGELNSIANSELGKLVGPGIGTGEHGLVKPYVPLNGFGFVPEYVYVQTGKTTSLILRANVPDKVEVGSLVTIESDSPEVKVLTEQVRIDERKDFTGIGEAKVEVEGRQVGIEAIITASLNGLKAEAMVKVISKREPPTEPPTKKKSGGLFREFKFDPTAEPKQRVRFDRANANIIIATKAPSVALYFDEHGNSNDKPQGLVLLAELVTEAVCFEIARYGVEKGVFLAPAGSEADAIRREHIILQNKYAHKIHECIVEPQYRRTG